LTNSPFGLIIKPVELVPKSDILELPQLFLILSVGVIMLIGIDPVIGPELLDVLFRMGHGDELVLADAFFPGNTFNSRVIRADGLRIPALLEGILALMNLDYAVPHPVMMMQVMPGETPDPSVEDSYRAVIDRRWPGTPATERIERFAFYERTKSAYAVVMTGETVKYGNIILKKGVIPVAKQF
jgi:L-fucose mutarotase